MTVNQYENRAPQPIAIVGISAIMPQAPTAAAFWENITRGRYSITDVPKERWDPALYYDPDPRVPDKTYSRIGGWVRDFTWDPFGWHLPLPPRVGEQMDEGQKWSVAAAHAVLSLRDDDAENAFVALAVKESAPQTRTVTSVNDSRHLQKIKRVQPDIIIAPQLLGGELTHTQPKPNDATGAASFEFTWQAPAQPGPHTLFGAGNSVNFNHNNSGDRAAATTFMVTVAADAPPPPTPTATATASPTPTATPSPTSAKGSSSVKMPGAVFPSPP